MLQKVNLKNIIIGSLLLSASLASAKNHSVFTEGLIKDITPKGWLLEYLQRMKEGMTGHPEALSYPYNTCLWAGDIPRNGDYGQDWWRYEQTAYYTDGLLRLGYLLKDQELISKGEEGIQYTLNHPQSNGRLGNGVISSLWPQAVFFRALKAYYEVTGDRKVRTALTNNYNSMTTTDLCNGRRHIVNIEGMMWLYGQQPQSALLTKAKTAYKNGGFELDSKVAGAEDFLYIHGVTYSEMLKIPMLLYAYTGDKSYLNLVGECHSLSYDALTAHVAIVFARYMMLALEQRKDEDHRTLGEIFFFLTDELADITFGESLQIILKAMFEGIYTVFQVTEAQIDAFIDIFVDRLPNFIQNSLAKSAVLD